MPSRHAELADHPNIAPPSIPQGGHAIPAITRLEVTVLRLRACSIALALGFLLATVSTARAENYFVFYLGASSAKSSDLRIRRPASGTDATFHGVVWHGQSFIIPPYYGVKFGTFLKSNPRWGVELEFTHYKVYAQTGRNVLVTGTWNGAPVNEVAPMNTRVQKYDISHGVNLVGINAVYRWFGRPTNRFPQGRLQPFVAGGPALLVLHPENIVDGVDSMPGLQTSGIGWQVGAGARYALSTRTGLLGEVKYSSGHGRVKLPAGGRGDTPLRAWHALLGFEYRF
jgi:hypothetical protein